jgi:hypothetical protein
LVIFGGGEPVGLNGSTSACNSPEARVDEPAREPLAVASRRSATPTNPGIRAAVQGLSTASRPALGG